MSEEPRPEPVLASKLEAWTVPSSSDLSVAERLGRSIVHCEWRMPRTEGHFDMLAAGLAPPGKATRFGTMTFLRSSPVGGLLVSDVDTPGTMLTKLAAFREEAQASLVDVSHGMVVLSIKGTAIQALVQGLVPANLDETSCGLDFVFRTHVAEHGMLVHCLNSRHFDLYVARSLAVSLWQRLDRRSQSLVSVSRS